MHYNTASCGKAPGGLKYRLVLNHSDPGKSKYYANNIDDMPDLLFYKKPHELPKESVRIEIGPGLSRKPLGCKAAAVCEYISPEHMIICG